VKTLKLRENLITITADREWRRRRRRRRRWRNRVISLYPWHHYINNKPE
jgi:hypothetical protein